MSHEKFIHHETYAARFASEDGGAGRFDVVEDEYGPYVSNADQGLISRWPSVEAAEVEAERLADLFDETFGHMQSITMSPAQADFIVRYLPEEAMCSTGERALLAAVLQAIANAFPSLPPP